MRIEVDKSYPIDAPAHFTWECLKDMEDIEDCMPGALITEKIDEHHYKGQVKVKLGPKNMVFDGVLEVLSENDSRREVIIVGTGEDNNGDSAEMELTASVEPEDGDHCEIKGNAIVTVSGSLANVGNRLVNKVMNQMLEKFIKNLSYHAAQRRVTGQRGDVGLKTAMSAYEDTYVESSAINDEYLSAVSDQNSHRIVHAEKKLKSEEYIDVISILREEFYQKVKSIFNRIVNIRKS